MPAGLLRRAIPVIVVAVVAALIVALSLGGDGTSRSTTTESGPGDAAPRESMPDKAGDTKAAAGSSGKRTSATPTTGSSKPDGRAFESLDDFDPADAGDQAGVRPRKAEAFRINRDALATELARAPSAKAAKQGAPLSTISVPDPDGGTAKFRIQETSVMEPGLAARHPEVKTYAGVGVTDPTATIRLDLTALGFHAAVREGAGARAWYVDPAVNEPGTTTHLSYDRADLPAPQRQFVEGDLGESIAAGAPSVARAAGEEVSQRTYRLAFVTDRTFAAHYGGTNILDAKATLINRVNQVYNDDLAIDLILVDGTDKLNLSGDKATRANGPCGPRPCFASWQLAGCGPLTIDRNVFVVGQILGAGSYDIGHLGLGKEGGGIAGIGVVGKSGKAAGCTGLADPEGDVYAIDYLAHEIGHQFAANHTFNGTLSNCSGFNRNPATSVEPGSGSSVMGYAGICGNDDLQPHSDPYFSQRSIAEITSFVGRAPARFRERQVVTLRGFNANGERFRLTYPGRGSMKVKRGPGGNYSQAGIANAVKRLTGRSATVRGYDGGGSPERVGFTVIFNGTADLKGLGVRRVSRGVSGYVRTIHNGGPADNRGTSEPTGNHHPSVQAPEDKTIPVRTPFTLTATGDDEDGDDLVYLWEQNNRGGSTGTPLRTNAKTNGPLFRVFGSAPTSELNEAADNSSRTFPDLRQILADNTNAEDGNCPTSSNPETRDECFSEFLPESTYDGALSFRVTARDLRANGGGTAFDNVTLNLDEGAGPFHVTSQGGANETAAAGEPLTVQWTTNTQHLASDVKISLSTNGGLTFPHVLAEATPNIDGSAVVTLPEVVTDEARIKVEAVDNYFFDISDADLSISRLTVAPDAATAQYSDPLEETVVVTAESPVANGAELSADLTGISGLSLQPGAISAGGERPGSATWTVTGSIAQLPPGPYTATVTMTDPVAGLEIEKPLEVEVTEEDATVEWTGPTEPVTTTEPTVTVQLSTNVFDAEDGTPGDIENAEVTFVDRETGAALCAPIPVTGGPGTGTAQCEAILTAPEEPGSTDYTIGTVVGAAYHRDDPLDDVEVTVERIAGP